MKNLSLTKKDLEEVVSSLQEIEETLKRIYTERESGPYARQYSEKGAPPNYGIRDLALEQKRLKEQFNNFSRDFELYAVAVASVDDFVELRRWLKKAGTDTTPMDFEDPAPNAEVVQAIYRIEEWIKQLRFRRSPLEQVKDYLRNNWLSLLIAILVGIASNYLYASLAL